MQHLVSHTVSLVLGAFADSTDPQGRTALMHAILTGHASTAALLTDRGCDITRTDKDGNSLLHLLARHPNKCLIDRLLDSGLSLESKNNEGLYADWRIVTLTFRTASRGSRHTKQEPNSY